MTGSFHQWGLAARLARRELRGGLRGFYIFLICLILGTGTIAAVQSLSTGMLDSLRHDSRYILGGDMSLRRHYTPATAEQLDILRREGPVSGIIDMRAMVRRADDALATMVELKAVDNFYPLYGALKTEPALPLPELLAEKDGVAGALVEEALLTKLGVAVGDTLKLGETTYRISAVIISEPDRMSGSRYTLAPRLLVSTATFDATGLGGDGSQVSYHYRLYMPHLTDRAQMEAAEDRLEEALGDGWRGRSYYNAAPGIKRSIDQTTLFLTLIGLSTLLIGGVGISNAVRGWLDGRLPTLATLKSLGATRGLVLRVYLLQILIIATFGIIIGLLIGGGLAQAGAAVLTAELSLSNQAQFSAMPLTLAAAFGYLTVFCFTLWPLGRAIDIAPRDLFRDRIAPAGGRPRLSIILLVLIAAELLILLAIGTATDRQLAIWFVITALGAFAVFQLYALAMQALLRRLRPQKMPSLRLAIANLARPGNATAAIVMSLGLGLTVLSAVALVESNLTRLLNEDLAKDSPSFFFLDVEPGQAARFAALLAETPGIEHVKLTPAYRGRIISVNGIPAEQALVDRREEWVVRSDRGFTYAAEQPAHSRIIEGEWWPAGYNTAELGITPRISIASDVQRAFDIGVGDSLTINIMGVEVTAEVANVRDINWASFTINFAVTFAPGALEGAPANLLATAVVPAAGEDALQSRIAAEMPNITSVQVRDALALAERLITGVLTAVRVTAAVTLAAGVLVLAGALSAARQRQLYDAVVFKVLGATRRRLMGTFLLEYALLGLVTAAIAAAIGTAGAWGIMTGIMEFPWHFSGSALASVVALALGITLLAGAASVARVLGIRPARYLRNQ